jgi:hypothetical protein
MIELGNPADSSGHADALDHSFEVGPAGRMGRFVFLSFDENQLFRGIADRFKIRRSKTIYEARDKFNLQREFQWDCIEIYED